MRFLLILIAFSFAACGGSSDESTVTGEMNTAADGLQESIDADMEKAENIEVELQQSKDDLDAAIDDASGEH